MDIAEVVELVAADVASAGAPSNCSKAPLCRKMVGQTTPTIRRSYGLGFRVFGAANIAFWLIILLE